MAANPNIFANGLQIAGKASQGKSTAAFPDPCFSPPAPPAGWVVIPYANTAYAKDTANASKTVFIAGKPVMLKDKSYFKTSTGNEAAAGPKGLATATKQGKAYFRSWSMDIKVEGYNVCRHTDLMTHNHNPVMGNTGPWNFLSETDKGKCGKEIKNIDKECGVSKKEQEKFANVQDKRNAKRTKRKGKDGRHKKERTVRAKTWKDKHCKALLFKPRPDLLASRLEQLQADASDLLEDMTGEVWDAVTDKAIDKAERYGARTAAKHVGGLLSGPAAPVVEAVIAVTDILDAAYSIVAVPFQLYGAYSDVKDVVRVLEEVPQLLGDVEEALQDEKKKKELSEKLINKAREAAENDDCLQARKCKLEHYNPKRNCDAPGEKTEPQPVKLKDGRTLKEQKGGGDFMTLIGMGHSGGCCPGQTGHHLIPASWAKKACPGYEDTPTNKMHNCAPVVCVEGISENDGSHQSLHYNVNKRLDKTNKERQENGTARKDFNLDEVMDIAVPARDDTFPKSGECMVCYSTQPCRKACVVAQLRKYYEKCGPFKPEIIPQKKEDKGTDF